MKKILHILGILMVSSLCLNLSSCSDDDNDLPDVSISVGMKDVSVYNNVIYVVSGEPFEINGIGVSSLNGKNAALTNVGYYWDGALIYATNVAPFGYKIYTPSLKLGTHQMQIKMTVLQEGKSLAVSWLDYVVKVVESADDIPDEAEAPGQITFKSVE